MHVLRTGCNWHDFPGRHGPDAEITAEAVPELTDADLRELGLTLGPQRLPSGRSTPLPALQLWLLYRGRRQMTKQRR